MLENITEINRQKYNSVDAFTYLNKKWHKVRIEKGLDFARDKFSDSNVSTLKALDIGCGTGEVAFQIKKLGFETFGIDVAEESLLIAKNLGIQISIHDINNKLFFDNNFFDFVIAGEIIEHICDPREFVCEVNRVLKPGGLFVLTTPNIASLDNRLRLFLGKIPRCIDPLSSHHYQHVRPFTANCLKNFLEKGGFGDIKLKTNRIKLGFMDLYKSVDLFAGLGSTLIVGAVKKDYKDTILLNEI